MSYIRFGFDSDVYLIGTYRKSLRVIECCGCKLNAERKPYTDEEKKQAFGDPVPEWLAGLLYYTVNPDPSFTTALGVCKHLDEHRDAGHQVPERAYDNVLADDGWLDGADGDSSDEVLRLTPREVDQLEQALDSEPEDEPGELT